MRTSAIRPRYRGLLLLLLLLAVVRPAAAQSAEVTIGGRVTDAERNPVAGCRVVYRLEDGRVVLSGPTGEQGEYSATVPDGTRCVPVAVILADGSRLSLEKLPTVTAAEGLRQEIEIGLPTETQVTGAAVKLFPGSDRLFLAFAEDAVLAEHQRYEVQIELADADAGDRLVSRGIVALQFDMVPRIEFGGRLGIGDVDGAFGLPGGDGLTDTELWAKLDLGPRGARGVELAVGALLTVPTGDEDDGLGFDAYRSKLFGAARWNFARFTIAAHGGVRFNGDGRLGPLVLDGQVAPAGGAAVLWPLSERLVLIGEAAVEGERFQGGDTDTRLLAGVNWQILDQGMLRFALAGGLADGAPNTQLFAGYATQF